jgi:hypothetical protein
MTEPVPEAPPPQTVHPPIDPARALARKNLLWGLALFGVFLVLFAATVAFALVYLALD